MDSDRSCSPVESEPLLVVLWHCVPDSEPVLTSTDVLLVENSSSSFHCGSDLEPDAIFQRISWEFDTILIDVPSLVVSGMARMESNILSVVIFCTPDIHTESSIVSEILMVTSPELSLLIRLVSPLSDDSGNSWSV